MNIARISHKSTRKTSKTHAAGSTAVHAKTKEIPVGFYDHVELYAAPHFSEDRQACIAKAAYFIAEQRGFAPGRDLEDWLAAENEVDQRLIGEGRVF
jgi:hypothetical protein